MPRGVMNNTVELAKAFVLSKDNINPKGNVFLRCFFILISTCPFENEKLKGSDILA